ncbi:MAG: hypothetical protein LBH98_08805 [Chitinispirillales bacterium]|jgi:hypothetical protein|nr:hypothetical protein [Chitinispirillales bacterium]
MDYYGIVKTLIGVNGIELLNSFGITDYEAFVHGFVVIAAVVVIVSVILYIKNKG